LSQIVNYYEFTHTLAEQGNIIAADWILCFTVLKLSEKFLGTGGIWE